MPHFQGTQLVGMAPEHQGMEDISIPIDGIKSIECGSDSHQDIKVHRTDGETQFLRSDCRHRYNQQLVEDFNVLSEILNLKSH